MTNNNAYDLNDAIKELDYILVGHPETSARGQAVCMAIEALEQPEVVHCKDCSISTFDKQTNLFYCNALDIYKEPEFYCGYARRQE